MFLFLCSPEMLVDWSQLARLPCLPIHMSIPWAFPHMPFPQQPPTMHHCRVMSHIELIVSDSEHMLVPFPHIMYNKHISLELY